MGYAGGGRDMKDVIFVDHSILSTFATCKEKARLSYVEHLRPIVTGPPLVFGSAFHAAVADYYTGVAQEFPQDVCRKKAHAAFLGAVREAGPNALPLDADSDEKRSVERGLYLIDAYIEKWAPTDINWEDVIRPDTGEPYIEIGFAVHFMDWHDTPVVCAGKIDRIRRNRVDGQLYNWETKTTGSNVSYYVQQVRPNHQITCYKWACSELLKMNVSGTILDVVYVSDRKIGGKFPNGIDIEKDFARVETRRSATDVEEFLFDLRLATTDFLELQDRKLRRWHRNAPAGCYMYGGCHYRDACNSNLNPSILQAKYKTERWEPWNIADGVVTKSLQKL
jgi:hypothetical protein